MSVVHACFDRGVLRKVDRYPSEKFADPEIGPDLYLVNDQVIKPLTNGDDWSIWMKLMIGWKKLAAEDAIKGTSWALMKNPKGLDIQLFVSHAWQEGIFEFETNLLAVWPDACEAAYICFLANPQNLDISKILGSKAEESPFALALSSPSMKHMIMLGTQNGAIHDRLWCCYEAFLALELQLDVKIAGNPEYLSNLKKRINNFETQAVERANKQLRARTMYVQQKVEDVRMAESELRAKATEDFQTPFIIFMTFLGVVGISALAHLIHMSRLEGRFPWSTFIWHLQGVFMLVVLAYLVVLPLAYFELYMKNLEVWSGWKRDMPRLMAAVVVAGCFMFPLGHGLLWGWARARLEKLPKEMIMRRKLQRELEDQAEQAEREDRQQAIENEEARKRLAKAGEVDVLAAQCSSAQDKERILQAIGDRAKDVNAMINRLIREQES